MLVPKRFQVCNLTPVLYQRREGQLMNRSLWILPRELASTQRCALDLKPTKIYLGIPVNTASISTIQ